MAAVHPPEVASRHVTVFTSSKLPVESMRARGAVSPGGGMPPIIAVLQACGIRLSELVGVCYDSHDQHHSRLVLQQREIRVDSKGGKSRIVKISYDTAPHFGSLSACPVPAPASLGIGAPIT
jgi:hypothetical protein